MKSYFGRPVAEAREGPRLYRFGKTQTRTVLVLRHAGQTRPFRMEFISNAPFTEACCWLWFLSMANVSVSAP
jgi:hypothetical protein